MVAHNKTLAAQLAQEYKEFFPNNAVHYFVSYYDYYQPEAYVSASDTYIEKEASINAEVERMHHAATQSLLTRKDVIAAVVAVKDNHHKVRDFLGNAEAIKKSERDILLSNNEAHWFALKFHRKKRRSNSFK